MTGRPDLEARLGWLSVAVVVLFGVLLGAGLLLHVIDPASVLSRRMLEAGLVTLMIAPAVRLGVVVTERLQRRDWMFVAMTLVIVLELVIVMWRAAHKP